MLGVNKKLNSHYSVSRTAVFVKIFSSRGLGQVGQGLSCKGCDEDTLEGSSVRVPRAQRKVVKCQV